MWEALQCVTTALAPMAPHTAQDIWEHSLTVVQVAQRHSGIAQHSGIA
jgi:leucyl-tRNA synthetase